MKRKIKGARLDQNTGVQTGDQELAWSRVLDMTDEDLRTDTSSVDRSKLNTYHFDQSLVNTSPQETSFCKPAESSCMDGERRILKQA